jgi:transglutaminase-like putative cysteine protease
LPHADEIESCDTRVLTQSSDPGLRRDVGCELTFDVTQNSLVAFQVAPSCSAGSIVEERFEATIDGGPTLETTEVSSNNGGRIHLVSAVPGTLFFAYTAVLHAGPGPALVSDPDAPPSFEAIEALRQSRYCPSDAFIGFARVEFADSIDSSPDHIAARVASWVFERLIYWSGSSGPLDTAVDTLLSGSGVCRDFAQLTITLCRALGVPARLASVYAPGLSPMDFHAVVEVLTPVGWQVLDPARLAPRAALVRIATGRDATDTALATTLKGTVELVGSRVFASSDGNLPLDDHVQPQSLA